MACNPCPPEWQPRWGHCKDPLSAHHFVGRWNASVISPCSPGNGIKPPGFPWRWQPRWRHLGDPLGAHDVSGRRHVRADGAERGDRQVRLLLEDHRQDLVCAHAAAAGRVEVLGLVPLGLLRPRRRAAAFRLRVALAGVPLARPPPRHEPRTQDHLAAERAVQEQSSSAHYQSFSTHAYQREGKQAT